MAFNRELEEYYFQELYAKKQLGTCKEIPKDKYGWWCAVCSLSKLLSEMFNMDLLPTALNQLLINNNGYYNGCSVIWDSIKNFFDVSVHPILWNSARKIHTDLDLIQPPCIISVDGNRIMKGYQSHFIYLRNWVYDNYYNHYAPEDAKTISSVEQIANAEVFCPISGNLLFAPHFGKDLKNNIYSVINIKRVNNG